MKLEILFDQGTLIIVTLQEVPIFSEHSWIVWDSRTRSYRCHAYCYRSLIRLLKKYSILYLDSTCKYETLHIVLETSFTPYHYQQEAVRAWLESKWGICVLPTGSGKSYVAAMIIEAIKRSTLIVVPTIDLLLQWHKNLSNCFDIPIGMLGGGSYDLQHITVSTYDSARIHSRNIGNQFCLLIFDECHHLPSPMYAEMARSFIAPYRLGLTATPCEEEDRIQLLTEIAGAILYSRDIQELSGSYLAPYEIKTIVVELNESERKEYEEHRNIYLRFKQAMPIPRYGGNTWENFVYYASRSSEGRNALKSFRIQKQISIGAEEKLNALAKIIVKHSQEQILIFTNDNQTAYKISGFFLLPLITHETKAKERKEILENFRSGVWPFLVSSRVLNEGVDVPEATVAVVISGTSTVREHVQRLGRILRKNENKKSILYEMVTSNTPEMFTSKKRRAHEAYVL